ncbi:MAG TPA: 5-methyltetrahydropteroyltriglutamate--homocysteine S-methyltransferase [Polyangiaceae bacterium]|nr:5-methyltetrahydropteroyltriglutamate--homocysteine S-methyltransferase [Polyangiaceae bacterium]
MSVLSSCLGHPRIGANRELKRALEDFWAGKRSKTELLAVARELRQRHWLAMRDAGIALVPSNDFSLYDHVLDTAVLFGVVPERYARVEDPLARYFAMARGLQEKTAGVDLEALEMTKWFDTNYHYIVPELEPEQRFRLDASKLLSELGEARALGVEPRPVLLGPVSFLLLAKWAPFKGAGRHRLDLLEGLLPVYAELLERLEQAGVRAVQLDEPWLALDLDQRAESAFRSALHTLGELQRRPELVVATYFEGVEEQARLVTESGCEGLHVDLARAPEQLDGVLGMLGERQSLSLGVIDGRNVWRADLDRAHALVHRAVERLGPERVIVATSCSLLHVPVDLGAEHTLDAEVRSLLAFARQKLEEVVELASAAEIARPNGKGFEAARAALATRRASARTRNAAVRARTAAVSPELLRRHAPFGVRKLAQRARLKLPCLPTTTIGSFPQTTEVRKARADFRAGALTAADYRHFLEDQTRRALERQEALGLDVLVHGEFERNDMVEYFGEKLDGFAFTEHGWVQSYGSRCVKPPVLFGDVLRRGPLTVDWARYAQSRTQKPVKGMLTGPVTILKWSFVRDDQPLADTCRQIALALRDEVSDLEAAGIAVIQVDEPAIREGLPLRRARSGEYLAWAVDAFLLATSGARDETQIHTHMCYSEFGDILDAVARMDADVVSIETSRSKMELLTDFGRYRYPNDVGPGVYDIHSKRVPSQEEMMLLIRRAMEVLPPEQLWVNPDCGLKTRQWPEVEAALSAMVAAARAVRAQLPQQPHLPAR